MSLIFATIPPKRLAQGITSASSSFYINNIIGFDTVDSLDVTSADLGTQHYCVFRNDTGSKIEIMEIDPTTISTGPITIVRRGLSYYGDRTTQTTANKLDWSANETIVQLGTDAPQIFQYLKEYIDAASIVGAVPASTTAAGIVVEGTQAQVDAKTATTTISTVVYKNFAPLDKIRATKYHDYAADSVGTDAYAITITPAITAYSAGQEFTFNAGTANTGACTLNVSGLGAKTIKKNVSTDLETGDILLNQIVTVVYDGTNMQMKSSVVQGLNLIKFGGDGSDGALAISSGTTTINCASAKVVVKNYTSISITGTGKLAFSNPHANGTIIIIKSQGNVTLTSSQAPMIDGSFLGAEGGAAVTRTTTGNSNGVAGTDGKGLLVNKTGGGSFSTSGVAGAGGTILSPNTSYFTDAFLYPMIHSRYPLIFVGAGGSSGPISSNSNGTGTSGVGGRGGGGIIIECSGAWNFTTAGGISVAGQNGGDGVNTSGATACSGGGGGGGGSFMAFYNFLTTNSGTVTVTGGTGGNYNESFNDSSAGGSGGGGYAAGQSGGTTGTSGVKNGGDGGIGLSLISAVTSV